MKSFSFLPFLVLELKSLKVVYHFNLYLTIRECFQNTEQVGYYAYG